MELFCSILCRYSVVVFDQSITFRAAIWFVLKKFDLLYFAHG